MQPDLLDFPVLEVIQVLGVTLVPVGQRVVEGHLEVLDWLEQPVQVEHPDLQVELDLLERVERQVCLGSLEHEEPLELKDQLEQLDQLGK